jgi:GTP cyclohydrolase IA
MTDDTKKEAEKQEARTLAEEGVRDLLEYLGQDPTREGLVDTPSRVIKAYTEMTRGYNDDPAIILSTTFAQDKAYPYNEMIMLRDIQFVSLCEHHLLPFTGTASVAYIPNENGQVVGLSKLARLVDCYAKRLQLQEQLTAQIADALMKHLNPKGAAVLIKASHGCMSCRGVQKDSLMVTNVFRANLQQHEKQQDFYRMLKA